MPSIIFDEVDVQQYSSVPFLFMPLSIRKVSF